MKSPKNGIASKIGVGAAGIALVVVIVVAANLILANARLRLDLTHERQYSLSDGTRRLLTKMDRDVTLKFYFSRSADMPIDIKTFAQHVEELLQEYRLTSHGRIIIESYDPKPDSDYEEWAQNDGLEPQTITPFAPPVYFGLVATCGSEKQAVPSFSTIDDARMEYTITRLVSRVLFPQKPVLGVLSSMPVMGMPMNPMMMQQQPRDDGWLAFKMLKDDYEVRTVPPETESIEPGISTLIVVHPKNLTDKTLFAIDQFVLRGGRLVACVDPLSSIDARSSTDNSNPMMRGINATPSTLGKLFDAWGVGFETTKVIADLRAVTQLAGQGQVIESPTFLWIKPDRMNRKDMLTAQLNQIMLPFAGSLVDHTAGGKLTFTPLLFSSADSSCPIDAMGSQFASVSSIRSQFHPDNIRHVLAARLSGTFKTAFPNGPDGAASNAPPNLLASGNSAVLIVADSDFLGDEFCVRAVNVGFGMQSYQPLNDNLTFFANAVEQLSGREELLSLRARGSNKRPFKYVDELDLRAMRSWQAKEGELSKELETTRAQINDLQQKKKGTQKLLLSKEQQEAIENFRQKESRINHQLKEVRKSLNQDKEDLGVAVKAVNIGAMSVLLVLFGIVRTVARRRR